MTLTSDDPLLDELLNGPRFRFGDWPVAAVPKAAAGVYSIWDQAQLLYVGMSGRSADESTVQQKQRADRPWGLTTRLASHASGRRSGDQFCVYVADFLILPELTPEDIAAIARREVRFDDSIKRYIHDRMCFSFVETRSGADAMGLEAVARSGGLGQLPMLNPSE